MKLTVLVENTSVSPEFQAVHGLSLYLEAAGHKLLMDVGPGEEFLHNADALGIDLTAVDLCAISHGHNDHGGGLGAFLKRNHSAPVLLSQRAFEGYFAGEKYIGLDESLKSRPQVQLVPEKYSVDSHIMLLSQIPGDRLLPKANAGLLDASGADSFRHEQVMLVEEEGKLLLLGGCAHRGIVNILEHVKNVVGRYPDVVVSGLHLAAGGSGRCMADDEYLDNLSEALMSTGAMFYSCHCTGREALEKLKLRMPGRLEAISTGMTLIL